MDSDDTRVSFFKKIIWVYFTLTCVAFLYLSPLLHTAVLTTISNDLANHIRHIYEYKLALLEHQFPPKIAPLLNGAIRIPLFQFYSGTAYTLPGLLSLVGVNEYSALKISIFTLSLLSAVSLYHALLLLVKNVKCAWIGALSFQLYTFSIVDLYVRGAYVEWTAIQLATLMFSCFIFFIHAYEYRKDIVWPAISCIVVLCYFICCHPLQTLYLGSLIAILLLVIILTSPIKRKKWLMLYLMTIVSISLALSSWFWLPILNNFSTLNVTHDTGFYSADTTPLYVLYPWFHLTPFFHWAPQVGLLASVASLVLLFTWKNNTIFIRTCTCIWIAALIAITSASNLHSHSILLVLFSPLQWSYRLLMTSALLTSLLIAFASNTLLTITPKLYTRSIVILLTAFVLLNAFPYMLNIILYGNYSQTLNDITSSSFRAPNSTASYTLKGLDLRKIILTHRNTLILNKNIFLPPRDQAIEVFISTPNNSPLSVFFNNTKINTRNIIVDKHNGQAFYIPKQTLHTPEYLHLISQASIHSTTSFIYYRMQQDTFWFRVLPSASYSSSSKTITLSESGFYQLPLCYYKGEKILIDGVKIEHNSANKVFFITYLTQGTHTIINS